MRQQVSNLGRLCVTGTSDLGFTACASYASITRELEPSLYLPTPPSPTPPTAIYYFHALNEHLPAQSEPRKDADGISAGFWNARRAKRAETWLRDGVYLEFPCRGWIVVQAGPSLLGGWMDRSRYLPI